MSTPPAHPHYPCDVSDEEWAFVAPYLALVREDAPYGTIPLREVLNGLRWLVRTDAEWRMLQCDLPRLEAVYQQVPPLAGCWRLCGPRPRLAHPAAPGPGPVRPALGGDPGQPHAAVDARKQGPLRLRRAQAPQGRGAMVHAAVDTLDHLLAHVRLWEPGVVPPPETRVILTPRVVSDCERRAPRWRCRGLG